MKDINGWRGPHRIGLRTELTLDHLLASSALPLLFPAVKIGTQFYGDGAVRQLAPTSTALHLGARRLLVIGVSGNKERKADQELPQDPPGLMHILGHIINSAFVDTLENDP
jgi:NTE family protein